MVRPDVLAVVFAAAVTVLNGVVLAFSIVSRMKQHAELNNRWILSFTEEADYESLSKRYVELSAYQPPPDLKALRKRYDLAAEAADGSS